MHLKKYLFLLLPALIYMQGCVALTETQQLQQLRTDYASLQQLEKEFDQTVQAGDLSARDTADFKLWIRQLQTRMAEDCLAVSETTALPENPPCKSLIARYSAPAEMDTKDEMTEAEKTARMVEQLNGSFGEFDERLLQEQDRVKSRKPRTDASGGAAGGGNGAEDGGAGDGNSDTAKSADDAGDTAGRDKQEQDAGDGHNKRAASNERGVSAKPSAEQKSTTPKDIPDGRNDDVIARQLREAAEKESDPELKKKLWDEYRRYKSGSRN